MTPLEQYFDRIYCLTLRRREDRQKNAEAVFKALGILGSSVEWVFGPDRPIDHHGHPNGNMGCTMGHRWILDDIVTDGVEHALVFEDDVAIAPVSPENLEELVKPQETFSEMIAEAPNDWDMLYLGGQYGSNPQYRHSEHVIRFNTMLTTSSYGVSWEMAAKMQPHISGVGPIDSLYGGFQPAAKCYVFEPRLFVQGPSVSDLTDKLDDNRHCMIDRRHVEMLLEGSWREGSCTLFDSKLFRRELAAPADMNGEEVIVGTRTYIVRGVQTPPHLPPWYRGEPMTYVLEKKCAPLA